MASRDQFVAQYRPLAENVGKALGVSPDALVAQWGLETGWGRSVVPGTNNLGNIKDFSGAGVAATDNMTGSRDKYRAYESPEAFGLDYVNLIGGNKRYSAALNTGDDAQAFATALKQGGYAEDPDYVRKMVATTDAVRKMGGFGDRVASALLPSAQAAGNVFDQFDAPSSGVAQVNIAHESPVASAANVFDQFDSTPEPVAKLATEPTTEQKIRGSIAGRTAQGFIADPLNAGAQMLVNGLPSGITDAVNSATQYVNDLPVIGPVTRALGMTPSTAAEMNANISQDEQAYQAARSATGNDGFDVARLAGNVMSTAPLAAALAPAAGLGVAGGIASAASSGAALGALQPVTEPGSYVENKLTQMAVGAGGGAALSGIGNVLTRIVSPRASVNPQVQQLLNEGITPTPGQILGGTARTIEDKAVSVPIVGDAIRAARNRGINELNEAALNRSMGPLGTRVTSVGREGVDQVQRAIGDAYDRIIPRLNFKADQQFSAELGKIRQMAQVMPSAQAQQLDNILRNQVLGKLTPQGAATGQNFREIESELNRLASGYRTDPSADVRNLGLSLDEILTSLRGNLQRVNPQAAQELGAINNAYGQLTILQRASGGQGAADGVFTPAQLSAAVRQGDGSVRKNAFARGDARMQDLSDAAKGVMSSTVPNSGTFDRAALVGTAAASMSNPVLPFGLGAAALPYLPGLNRLTASVLARRPDIAPQLANRINSILPAAGAVAVPALNQLD